MLLACSVKRTALSTDAPGAPTLGESSLVWTHQHCGLADWSLWAMLHIVYPPHTLGAVRDQEDTVISYNEFSISVLFRASGCAVCVLSVSHALKDSHVCDCWWTVCRDAVEM
jgi:hypothetical protein